MLIYMLYCENVDEVQEFEQIFPDILKNAKYSEIKKTKLRGSVGESTHNKYFKKLTKEIKNFIAVENKKFRVTRELEKIKEADFGELTESGLTVESVHARPNNIKIQRYIMHCLGGACFHEYGNIT
jgi:hypothetical protein